MNMLESFNNYVDGFLLGIIIFVSAIIVISLISGLIRCIRKRIKKRTLMKIRVAQSAVQLHQDTELIKSHIASLNQCTAAISKFIEMSTLINQKLEKLITRHEKVCSDMSVSASNIENNLKILDYRDNELHKEIAALRFAETLIEPELYVKIPIEFPDLNSIVKNALHRKLNCHTIGDVLYVMLKFQRRGLLHNQYFGKNTVERLEMTLLKRGLISIHEGMYRSNIKSDDDIKNV